MTHRLTKAAALGLALSLAATTSSAHFEEGQIWIIDQLSSRLYFVNPANFNVNVSLDATDGLAGPAVIGFSLHGDMLVGNYATSSMFEIEGDLAITPVLSATDGLCGPFGGNGIAIGPGEGDVYVTNFNCSSVVRYDKEYANGVVFADASDGLVAPGGLAFLANGDLLIADRRLGRGVVFLADPAGNVTEFYESPTSEVPISITVRNNRDIYMLMKSGQIVRLIGGDPLNEVVLGTYSVPVLRGGISMSADHSQIFHVTESDSSLRSIDPDSGVDSILATIPGGGGGTSLVAPGAQYAPGTAIEFGDSVAGTGGIDPTLEGLGEVRTGETFGLEAANFVGGSQIFMFIGVGLEETTFLGAEFHIDLNQFYILKIRTADGTPGVAGAGSKTLGNIGTIPNDPTLVYAHFYAQAFGTDSAAPQGGSFTNCVDFYIGE